jgi:hypothetical protein
MKKRAASIGIFFLGMVFFYAGAFAYDDLVTNDAAETNAAGEIRASLGLVYLTAAKTFDSDGESVDLAKDSSQLRVPLKVSYGIRDRFTLFAVLPYASLDNGSKTTSGIGDVWLGVKYRLLPENLLTLRGTLDLTVDSDDASGPGNPGGPGIDLALMTIQRMDRIGLDAQAGFRVNGEDENKFAPGTGFYLDVVGGYSFTEAFQGKAGLQFKSVGDGKMNDATVKSGNHTLDLTVGAAYRINERMDVRGDILYTLAGKNVPRNFGVALAFGHRIK